MMATPPKPSYKSKTIAPAAKTPHVSSTNLFQRNFKSELQPNRVSTRCAIDVANVKSSTRSFYPSTSQRPTNKSCHITTRLGNFLQLKPVKAKVEDVKASSGLRTYQAQPVLQIQPQPDAVLQTQPHPILQAKPHPVLQTKPHPVLQTKPHPVLQTQPHHVLQTQLQTQPKTPFRYQSLSQSQQQPIPPPKISLNLIQDTRGPTQQAGPLATATKAPLSVSQYTQPTPLPSNRSAHQVSRAQSEPSIKYQVKVNDKTYKILRKIGSGGSAKVYEGFEPQTSQTVAIKIINIAQADQATREGYFNEKSLLTKLRDSKHVVQMYDSEYKTECKELIIVMEKGDADLSQVIDTYFKTKDTMIDGIFIKFYWRGMVQAVDDIHKHGIVHADLKPVNFILVKNKIKLIDFGIAGAVEPEGTSIIRDYQIGTVNYMAPEALRNRAGDASFQLINDFDENKHKKTVIKYNAKADIWSLGCILYNLVYGKPPFNKYTDIVSKIQAITDSRHVIQFPEISNQNLLNCMKSCLRYNPAERPAARDLLEDAYLKEDIIQYRDFSNRLSFGNK